MSELSFILDSDETAVLELKLGQYLIGDKGDTGQAGPPGPDGSLKPSDVVLIDQAVADSQAAASAAAGSATAAANSATNAANSAALAQSTGQAAAEAAAASATAAANSATTASGSAGAADGSATAAAGSAAAGSAAAAKTSETNSAQWEALAKDWATKLAATVDGVDYSAKYYAQASSASATTATQKAAAADASATAAAGSASAAATSATNAKTSETNAAASAGNAASTLAGAVAKTGDTMTGALTMKGPPIYMNNANGAAGSVFAYDPNIGTGLINAAGTAWNFSVSDVGNVTTRAALTVGGPINLNGGRLNLRQPGTFGEAAFLAGDGTAMFVRGRASGGGMEWVNNAYNAVVASMDDGGQMGVSAGLTVGNGGGRFETNGNVWMQWCNGYLSDQLAARAPNGAQVQWNSGIQEIGQIHSGGGDFVGDASNPWVMEGLHYDVNNWIHHRCIWQRNA